MISLGNKPISFAYHGNNLVYPNPIEDGLILWYDFKGMTNSASSKITAKDLSENRNDSDLKNFSFSNGSGYEEGLNFDGIDDYIGYLPGGSNYICQTENIKHTFSFCVKVKESKRNNFLYDLENLKIDLYGESIRRNGGPFNISISNTMINKKVYVDMVFDGTNHYTYINNVLKDTTVIDTSQNMNYEGIMNIGYYVPEGRPNIELYFLKVYDRELSKSELDYNYGIEKERWNL